MSHLRGKHTGATSSNANHSVNTIDTLDDDLNNLNNNASSSLIRSNSSTSKTNVRQAAHLNANVNTSAHSLSSLTPNNLASAAATISISGSMEDDGSASSEVVLLNSMHTIYELIELIHLNFI